MLCFGIGMGLVQFALGIAVESPQRGTNEDLQRKARPGGKRPKNRTNKKIQTQYEFGFFS